MSVEGDIKREIHKLYERFKETRSEGDLLSYYKAYRRLYRYQLKVEFSATIKDQLDYTEEKIKSLQARADEVSKDLPCQGCRYIPKRSCNGGKAFINCPVYRGPAAALALHGCSDKVLRSEG